MSGLHLGIVCWPHLSPVAHCFRSRRFTWRGRSGSRRVGIGVWGRGRGSRGVSGCSLYAVQPALLLLSDAQVRLGSERGRGMERFGGPRKRGSSNRALLASGAARRAGRPALRFVDVWAWRDQVRSCGESFSGLSFASL
jgi:hypothetical protein